MKQRYAPTTTVMFFVVLTISSAFAFPAGAEALTEPLIACVRLDRGPKTDGKLDDECWKKAIWTSHFHAMRNNGLPPADIWMGVAHTTEALYIGWNIIKHDKKDIVRGDHKDFVFMFLQPDRDSDVFLEFTCGAAGKIAESRNLDYTWKVPWQGVGRLTPTGWSAEVMIPFKSLGVGTPKPGDVWGFNPMRKNPKLKGKGRYVVWAEIGDRVNTADYGRLLFVDKLPELRMELRDNTLETPIYISPLDAVDPAGIRVPEQSRAEKFAIANPSFERKLLGWSVRYSRRTYAQGAPVAVTEKIRREGGRSLCVTSVNPSSLIQVTTKTTRTPPGRYELSAYLRLEDPSHRDGVNVFVSAGSRAAVRGAEFALLSTMVDDTPTSDGWRRQAIRFDVPEGSGALTLGVEVYNYVGRLWIDDFRIRKLDETKTANDGLWFWDARMPDKNLMEPRKRLFAMIEAKSPWVARAQKYNDTLVAAAFARDKLARLQRARVYNGAEPDAKLRERVDAIYEIFDRAARTFNDLYTAKRQSELAAKLDPLLAELEKRVKALDGRLDEALAAEAKKAAARAGRWAAVVAPAPPKRARISPEGAANRLIIGNWGKLDYRQLGRALDVWRHCGSISGLDPKNSPDGTLDWSGVITALNDVQKMGVETIGLRTLIMCGNGGRTPRPRAWRKKYGADKDIQIGDELNQWHPAVRRLHEDLGRSIGETLRGRRDILYYHYAWESYGPMRAAPDASPSGMKSLHAYLKSKYKTIRALNRAWGAELKSFDEITTALLKDPGFGKAFNYDYQAWRNDVYIAQAKAFYEACKKADPGTAVLAAHNSLFRHIDPTRIFETCDMVELHTSWSLPGNLYLASTAAAERKHTCKYENTWQYQSGANRWGDERAQFAAIAKYLYRNALLGQMLQVWCFPYTSQPGWMWRQAQWCQTRNDYLTLRYSASALPVAKRRVERMQQLFFLAAERDFADVLVVWPRTSWMHLGRNVGMLRQTVSWLHKKGICFEYRTEQRIISGAENLDDYKLIILDNATFLGDGVARKLIGWVRKGGTLVTIGPAGLYDKFGRGDGALMTEMIGIVPVLKATGWDFGPKYANTPLIQEKVGRGRVVVLTILFRYMLDYGEVTEKFEGIIRRAAPPLARSDGGVFEFYRRRSADGTKYLAVLNPNPDAAVTSVITLRGEFKGVIDIDFPGGMPADVKVTDGLTRFTLRLQPAGMTVLRLDK